MTEPLRLDISDGIATITLDRPKALNAFDESMITAVSEAIQTAAMDAHLKAVVITGAGDTFSVGLDIGLLERAFADPSYFKDVLKRFNALLRDVEAAAVPVIAAVNGLARAGGFELMLACDIVLIADEARVGDTHLAFGVVPGGGATQRAPRKLGWQRAADLIFTGRWMDGKEAAQYGLALRSVARASLGDSVEELVSQLRPLSRACLAATKRAMLEGIDRPLEEGLEGELTAFMEYLETDPSAREGFNAFVQKRAPVW